MGNPTLIGTTLYDIDRCPQCGVANPLLTTAYKPTVHQSGTGGGWYYATLVCSKCKEHTLFYGYANRSDIATDGTPRKLMFTKSYPSSRSAADDIPERARRFLQQALDSLHAPDGAVMLAASSVDAMLKDRGYKEGALYTRIKEAHLSGLLTEEMRDWAHEIRLSANEPRHADDQYRGANTAEAKQIIEFAEALGEYLYVLPARVKKWKAAAIKRAA